MITIFMSQAEATNRGCVGCKDAFTICAMSLPVCFERNTSQIIFIFFLQILQSGMSYNNSTIPHQMANSCTIIVPVQLPDHYYQQQL